MATLTTNPFYVPSGPMPNPFAEFWANFLQTRLPVARQIFTARLAELSSSQQNAALAKLAEQRVKLADAMAENARAREKNALDESLSESRLLGDWLDYHGTVTSANTRAAADLETARINYAGRALEAGTLSSKGRDTLQGYTEQLRAGQIALQNATTPDDARRAMSQISEASNNAAAAAAALPPLERNSFNNAVQQELGRLIVTDNADQAAVRSVVSPAFPPAPEIAAPPTGGAGARPLTPESAADAVRSLRSGMGSAPKAQQPATDSTPKPRAETADPRRRTGARGLRTVSERDIKRAERETSSGATPRREASPEGKGQQPARPPSGAGSPPTKETATAAPKRRAEGTGADAPLVDAASELDAVQARLENADPFGGLGGFVDPLPGGKPRRPKGEGRSIVEGLRRKPKAQESMGSVQTAMREYETAAKETPPAAPTPKPVATTAEPPKAPVATTPKATPKPVATTPKATPKPAAATPTMGDVKLAEQRMLNESRPTTTPQSMGDVRRKEGSDAAEILKGLRPPDTGESDTSVDDQIRALQPEQTPNPGKAKPAGEGSYLRGSRAQASASLQKQGPSAEEILRGLQPEQSASDPAETESESEPAETESELTEEELAELRKKRAASAG